MLLKNMFNILKKGISLKNYLLKKDKKVVKYTNMKNCYILK